MSLSKKSVLAKAFASVSLAALTLLPIGAFAAVGDFDSNSAAVKDVNYNTMVPTNINALWGNQNVSVPGVAKADPRAIVTNIIGIVSGFLGIIAVIIILISGFQWMTAGGDEEAVKKAQTRLVQGVIGLILILSTWSIAYYVVNTLSTKIFQS